MRCLVSVLISLCTLLLLGVLHGCTGYWVGPAWGYDGEDMGDDYFSDEVKRAPADMSPPFLGIGGVLGRSMQKRTEDNRIAKFYCVPDDTKACKMGGKGPTIYKKISANLAICVCYCPTGYVPKKGCISG